MGLVVLRISYFIVAPYGPISSQSNLVPSKAIHWAQCCSPWSSTDKLVTSIDADNDCLQLLLEAWYLDDGVLAEQRSAAALHLIGPYLGLYINFSKCELFSRGGNSLYPPVVKSSFLPNLDTLVAPIGNFVHCSRFIAEKCARPKILLKALVDVSKVDLHVAFSLLRMCGSYCKLVHLARATPPNHCTDYL